MKKYWLLALGIIIVAGVFFITSKETKAPSENTDPLLLGTEQTITPPTTDAIDVSLVVSGKTYSVKLQETNNVLDLMKFADEMNDDFTFESKVFEGLGEYIDSINGVKGGTDNKYWIYYINGKLSQVGVSEYKLKDKDVIEWKFESDPL